MSYFEKIGSSISNKSKDIVRKAKDASEVSSLNSIIKNENQKIELNYKMMGKLYFDKYGSAPADDFASAITAIKESMDKIAETQEMIKKIKGRRCCPACMTPFKTGSLFCAKCGTKLAQEQSEIVCFNCGNLLGANAQFCNKCGTMLSNQETDIQSSPQAVNAITTEVVSQKKKCPSCGAVSEDELAAFCNDCGTKIL